MKRPEALPTHSWWTLFQRPHCHLAAAASSWFHLILKHSTCYVGKSSPGWGWRTVRIAWFVNSLSVKSWCRELFIIYWKIKGTPPPTHTTITVLFPELSGLSPASNMKQKKKVAWLCGFCDSPILAGVTGSALAFTGAQTSFLSAGTQLAARGVGLQGAPRSLGLLSLVKGTWHAGA